MLDGTDAAADGDADDHRQRDIAQRSRVQFGDLADDVVEGGVDEAVELDLHHRLVTAQRHPDRGRDDARFGERGVDDPVLAEVLLQALGDPEDATELADVLPHEQHLGVGFHRGAQAGVERLGQCQGAHDACAPSKLPR